MHLDLYRRRDIGFRLYGQACLFVYSILQFILKDSFLGPSCNWDHYLSLNFEDPEVVFVSKEDFMKGSPLQRVLQRCQISTPSRFLEITQKFFVSLCNSLLGNKVLKSDFLRGLSSFDFNVLLSSPSEVYLKSFDRLVDHFIYLGHISCSDRGVLVSEYRSYVCHLRSINPAEPADPITFFMSDWELMARPLLYQLFKLSCCCCQLVSDFGSEVAFSFPSMGLRPVHMSSLLNCLRSSLPWLSGVYSFTSSEDNLSHLRDLFRNQEELFTSPDFSPWDDLRKIDRPQLQKKLMQSARKHNPVASSSSGTVTITESPAKVTESSGAKRGRVGSTSGAAASEGTGGSTSCRSRSQSPADSLSAHGISVFKAPSSKIPRSGKQ